SFEEESEKSLISETVTVRSSIHSFSSAAHLSPAQNAAKLSLYNSAVSLSSLCEEASVQSLISITTCLYCVKQLKKKRILYICFFSYFCYFCYICNNNFYLSILKQYRVRVSELQVLVNFIKTEKISLTYLQKKVK
ncbi:hypothetical protein BDDG_12211, partial [Blastomyces dermatitidis ATCC 18188]